MKNKGHPILVVVTAIVLIGVYNVATYINEKSIPKAIKVDVKEMPTLGSSNAPVHIVVFEEPKCSACSRFQEEVFPQIREEFIDKGVAKFTVVVVSFLLNSQEAAEALCCVYHQNKEYPDPQLYFKFLHYMYQNEPEESQNWVSEKMLLSMAEKTSPAIDLQNLQTCLETQQERVNVMKNTQIADKMMQGQLMTPTVYVNGMKAHTPTYERIKELIETALSKGVKS